jgi:ATP-dependent RNA helicase DDX54/DBP10
MAFFSVKYAEKEAALLYILRHVIKVPISGDSSQGSQESMDNSKKKKHSSQFSVLSHQTIIFVATKHHVEYISSLLTLAGYESVAIYGSLDQSARKTRIEKFRSGRANLLVVTDVAARGIDIPILENVINYDFVDNSKVFVHRVGRTARAGRRGWAYSLITSEEVRFLH